MRKVTEKTFKAYAKEAVKQLNTLEIRATLSYSCMGAEISLYREGSALVGHISISPDGLVRAKDLARNESFNIEPWHDNMKGLFNAMYEAVNSRLDDNGFKAEEECELTDEQIVNIAGRLYAGGWTMLDVDMIAEKTGTNKKTAHRIMIQIGMYINHTLPEDMIQESEEAEKLPVIEEPQPTPEEADREVTYIDFKPEQDYEEERPPHAAFEQLRRDSIEPPKIWSCKALKVQEILQKIYEGKTKTSGERLDAYYNHCYNLILASRIFLPECMYHYLERKLSNEMVIAGVCPAVIEEAFGYKKTRRKWYWKL